MAGINLAVLGGSPFYHQALPVGQLYFPTWDEYEKVLREIFERRYYTNHGPLVEEFENKLADFLNVKNAICVSNATIGLCILLEAMEIKGKVIVPAFTFISTIQAILWCGLQPVLCDIAEGSHHMDANHLEELLDQGADAVLAVNLWGGCVDICEVENLCSRYNTPVVFDSAQAFGVSFNNKLVGSFGKAEVFSFHATKIVSATEGGVITTNDVLLAEKMRNIRSSYGVRKKIDVYRTANGRMSEAQAAIGLISLSKFTQYRSKNELLFYEYDKHLKSIPGITVLHPENVDSSNYQYLVCEVDKDIFGVDRDKLILSLQAENIMARKYFNPLCFNVYDFEGVSDVDSLKQTKLASEKVIQLPLGASVELGDVFNVCKIIRLIHKFSVDIKEAIKYKELS